MRLLNSILCLPLLYCLTACDSHDTPNDPSLVMVQQGLLRGYVLPQNQVMTFKGVPYAAAPTAERRWLPPQAPAAWKGVKVADDFGHKCMQNPLFSDMQFRASGMSEDCLFLNIWTPVEQDQAPLPVLVYFYGGGFVAGDGSEKRYDGASMAARGIVTVTVNYRLGLFGFLAHPELSAQSQYKGSGNYGLLDQQAALLWVAQNIAAFGGDPKKITIAGESAGSISVSAQMLAADSIPHIAGAIAESGSIMGRMLSTLADAEQQGVQVAQTLNQDGTASIDTLRAMPADELLRQASQAGFMWFRPTIDGKILSAAPGDLLRAKKFANVPLLAGVNSQEGSYQQLLGETETTVDNYLSALQKLYPEHYVKVAELYPASDSEQVKQAAQALMSDRFISASTWHFAQGMATHGSAATYYYLYDHIRPPMKPEFNQGQEQQPDLGAVHSAEIEYALGNLQLNDIFQWSELDYQVSDIVQRYFVNFIKTGNPNSDNLTDWPLLSEQQQLVLKQQPEVQTTTALKTRYQGMTALQL